MSVSKDRIRRLFFLVCQAIFLLIAVVGLTRDVHDQAGWLGLLGLAMTFVPDALRRSVKLVLPFRYEIGLMFLVFVSLIAGEYFDLYGKFLWWDEMLHFVSGLVIGYGALLILHIDDGEKNAVSRPGFAVLFVLAVGLGAAAAWELFEYAVDQLALGHMQYGLIDTMDDMTDAAVGTAIMAFIGYQHYKHARFSWLRRQFRLFIERNPHVAKGRK